MKKYILMLIAIIFIAAIVFTGPGNGKTKAVKEDGVLSVNDIQSDPAAYKGTVTITGVVSRISGPNQRTFMLVDTHEAKLCKSTHCAKFYLPVQAQVALPKEWDEVNVTGSFVQGGKIFQAAKVEVIRHLTF
ncbi:MAG: hypothetical protein EPN22_00260 [Nitrospirae bacterium]|nr:MAG: hypothetical protein EPN22_00260 [Nitrospirota bacterium]